jgi:hypothetical protein
MSGSSLSEESGVSPTVKTDAPPICTNLIYVIIYDECLNAFAYDNFGGVGQPPASY